jgi:hypothetical protein
VSLGTKERVSWYVPISIAYVLRSSGNNRII